MISKQDIQRLLHRPAGEAPILSVLLDMSVNSENKRTHTVFLSQRRNQYIEFASDRDTHHREALGETFARVERWLEEEFDEANRGVAIYAEVGGDWFEAIQFPVPVRNRAEVSQRPLIGPLAQIVESYHHHGVIVVDREHLRLLSVYLGEPIAQHEVRTQPYPAPHDVKRGGYSQKNYQKRKAEEVRHFFKEFALEVAEFDRRYRPDDLIVLGTDENVSRFLEAMPQHLQDKVVHKAHAPVVPETAEILERLSPFFLAQLEEKENRAVQVLHERMGQRHFAIGGVTDTLEQLQEGKVDTLVLARDFEQPGSCCLRCGFYQAAADSACPYCGGDLRDGIDLVEEMIRIAEEQEIPIAFVSPEAITDLNGAGALLKF